MSEQAMITVPVPVPKEDQVIVIALRRVGTRVVFGRTACSVEAWDAKDSLIGSLMHGDLKRAVENLIREKSDKA